MRHSWNEIRARAAKFAEDWKDAAYEKSETQSFYMQRHLVASWSMRPRKLGDLADQIQIGEDFEEWSPELRKALEIDDPR